MVLRLLVPVLMVLRRLLVVRKTGLLVILIRCFDLYYITCDKGLSDLCKMMICSGWFGS